MYKTKLQEVCHKRKWAAPSYTALKCGANHESRYRASVSVNGASFDSLLDFNSLKQAHNHVARIALFHFTSPTSGSDRSVIGQMVEKSNQSLDVSSNGTESQYKNELQVYAKRGNLNSPSYSVESDGSPGSLFKATVRVSGLVFESTGSFTTTIEAENSAAKNALNSLLVDKFHKDEVRSYKSLLQELSHREGFCAPVYKTTNFGESWNRKFSSTVQIEGEKFSGKSANSKKCAEQDASRVAYLALQQRAASRMLAEDSKSTQSEHESLENSGLNSSSIGKLNLLNSSASNSSSKRDTTYLLNNKARVYRKFPNRPFPEGIIVLPIDENKWVAVSLELPNQEEVK